MKRKNNATSKINTYLKRAKNGATAPEIAKATGVNLKTVRNRLGEMVTEHVATAWEDTRNCRVTGRHLFTYTV